MENSAKTVKIMPEGKPSKSLIAETGKSGDLGAMSPDVKDVGFEENTGTSRVSESYASKSGSIEARSIMPGSKPSKSFREDWTK